MDKMSRILILYLLVIKLVSSRETVLFSDFARDAANKICQNLILVHPSNQLAVKLNFLAKVVGNHSIEKIHAHQRFASFCSIALYNIDSSTSDKIAEFSPKTKVLSLFLFYSKSMHKMSSLLKSDEVATKIKFKLGILLSPDELLNQSYSTCMFCGTNHESTITKISPNFLKLQQKTFHGKLFRMSDSMTAKPISEIRLDNPKTKRWTFTRGIFKFAWDHLADKFNLTAEYFPSPTLGTGRKLPNGTWTGTTGDLISGTADICAANAEIYQRFNVIDYTVPVQYIWITFTTGVPQPFYTWQSIYHPLEPEVWLFTLLNLVIVYFTFCFLTQRTRPNFIGTFMFTTFMEQGNQELGTRTPVRTFAAFWLIFQIVITTAYRSKLVSLMTFPVMLEPPETFQKLADGIPNPYNGTLQYNRGALYQIFRTSTSSAFRKIFEHARLEESDSRCYLDVIGNPGTACIAWNLEYDYITYKNLSRGQVKVAPETSTFISLAFALPKGSIFGPDFDGTLRLATDMGLLRKWLALDGKFIKDERKIWEGKQSNDNGMNVKAAAAETNNAKLKLQQLQGARYLCTVGLVISSTVFLIEYVYSKICHFGII